MIDFNALNIDVTQVVVKSKAKGTKRKLLKYLSPGVFAIQIDNSSNEVNTTCSRSAEYKLVLGREAPPGPALVYGSAIHNGLEVWYNDTTLGHKHIQTTLNDVMDAVVKTFEEPVPLNEWRTPDKACDTLIRYMKTYADDPFQVLLHEGKPCVEMPFSLPLGVLDYNDETLHRTFKDIVDSTTWPEGQDPEEPVRIREVHVYWTGKIDLIGMVDGLVTVMDHKTTSMGGPTFFDDFELSSQTVGYTWAVRQILGIPVNHFMVNAIIGRKPTRTGISLDLSRQRYFYSDERVKEWELNTLVSVSDFISNLLRNYFPMAPKWCMGKYGKCKYHDVCSLPEKQRMPMLMSDQYSDVTWSPLNE